MSNEQSTSQEVVSWVRPVYATEAVEHWEKGDLVDVEFHNQPERPDGEGWRPLVFAGTNGAAQVADIEALQKELAALKAENERLAEALRELVAVFSESGMYDEEVFAKARAALSKENSND